MTLIRTLRRLPLAAPGVVASVAFALVASPTVAATAAVTPLSGTVSYSMPAPYVDSVRGTAISVSLTGSAFREDDSVFFGVIARPGAAPTQVQQMDPTDDVVAGYHASASVSYPKWTTIGTVNWRVWIDANDNRKFDAGEKTVESRSETAFKFAGPPTSINLDSTPDVAASGTAGDESYSPATIFVAEGTCRMFHATVRDENGLGVKGQQIVVSFESGVPGSKPVACSEDQLVGLSAGAATTQDSANILTAVTNNDGEVDFAIQGVKGKARYRGAVSLDLKATSPKTVTASSVDVVTKTGSNKGVAVLTATGVDTTPYKKSKSSFTVTATSADGLPLQGVVLSAAAMPVDGFGDADTPGSTTTIATLAATNAAGQTTYVIDTSKASVQRIYVWADLATKGLGDTEIRTVVDIKVQPQAISRVNSEFTAAQDVLPTDKANNTLTLTLKDTFDQPVKDIDVTFEQVKGASDDADVTITPLSSTTDGFGQITLGVSRPSTNKDDQNVCVRASVTASITGDTFLSCFSIEFRRAATLELVTPSRFTAVNGSTTRIRAKLLDQFKDGFSGPVVLKSISGRNKNVSSTAMSNAAGVADLSWVDKAGAGTGTDTISISHTRVGDKEVLSAPAVQFDYVTAEQAVADNIGLSLDTKTYLNYDVATQPTIYVRGRLQNSAGNSLFGRDVTVTATGPVQLLTWNGSAWTLVSKIDAISDGEEGGFDVHFRATGAAAAATFTVSDGTASRSFTTTVVATSDGARTIAVSLNKSAALSGDVVRATVAVTDAFGNAVTPNGTLCAKVGGIGRFTTGRLREYVSWDDFDNGTAAVDVITNGGETGSMSVSIRPCNMSDDHFWAAKDFPFTGAPAATASAVAATAVTTDGTLAVISTKLDALIKSSADAAALSTNKLDALIKSSADAAAVLKQTTDLLNQVNGQLVAVNTVLDSINSANGKIDGQVKRLQAILTRYAKAAKIKV